MAPPSIRVGVRRIDDNNNSNNKTLPQTFYFFSSLSSRVYQEGVLPLRHNVFVDDIDASHLLQCGNPIHYESLPRRVAVFKTNVAIPR